MYDVTIAAGRVGRDAELRYGPDGTPVLGFSLAVDRGYGDNKKTVWFACSVWGDRAEKLAQYITKGTALLVEGTVDARAYTPRDGGEPRAALELRARTVRFLGGGRDGDASDSRSASHSQPTRQTAVRDADDGSIPF